MVIGCLGTTFFVAACVIFTPLSTSASFACHVTNPWILPAILNVHEPNCSLVWLYCEVCKAGIGQVCYIATQQWLAGWDGWHDTCTAEWQIASLRWAVWPLSPLFTELYDLWVHSSLSCMTSGSTLHWAVWPLGPLFTELYDLWVHSSLSCITSGSTLHWAVWPLGPLFAELYDLWVHSSLSCMTSGSTLHWTVWPLNLCPEMLSDPPLPAPLPSAEVVSHLWGKQNIIIASLILALTLPPA